MDWERIRNKAEGLLSTLRPPVDEEATTVVPTEEISTVVPFDELPTGTPAVMAAAPPSSIDARRERTEQALIKAFVLRPGDTRTAEDFQVDVDALGPEIWNDDPVSYDAPRRRITRTLGIDTTVTA